MAGQRIDIMEIRTLIALKQKGLSNRKVAALLQINRKTVDAYTARFTALELGYDHLGTLTEAELRDLFTQESQTEKARYETLAALFPYLDQQLKKPGATLQVLWREYLDQHPLGYRYTQFTQHYRRYRQLSHHSGKLTHKAGQKLFVDFCGKKLSYIDKATGEQVAVEVFVAVLPASQYTYVQAAPGQKREDLIGCLKACLEWLGGVPQAIVSDNLKAAVSQGSKHAPLINKTLKDFALCYGCVVDPARPHHPQDKALVERSVTLVYQRIYYELSRHTFFSLHELNQAIRDRLASYNDCLFSHGDGSRRSHFVDLEQAYLQPLPSAVYSLRHYRRARVQKTAHVYLSQDRNYYSVPYRFTGLYVEVQYNQDVVEVLYNHERIALHRRSYRAGHYSTVAEHMPSSHQAYGKWSPAYFEQKAGQVGEATLAYIQRLLGQYTYPEIAYKQSQGILAFAGHYGKERLEAAATRALLHHRASYHTVANILKNRLDQEPEPEAACQIPRHGNIRGAAHYS